MRFAALILAALVAVDPWGFDRFGPLRFALISTIGCFIVAAAFLSPDDVIASVPRRHRLAWAMLLGGLALSTLLSDDRLHALIGTPDRHLGLVTWLLFAGLFVATAARTRSDADDTTIFVLRGLALGTLLVGGWALAESLELGDLDQDFANDRVGGTFGQPAFLGAAMALALPPTIAAARTDPSPAVRGLATLGAGVGAMAFVLSGSRAAWVGLGIVAVVLLVARRERILDHLGPQRAGLAAGVGLGVLAMIALLTPAGDRLWSLTDIGDGVVGGRIDEWQVGLRALFSSNTFGLLGHGPEGYRTVFGEHVDPAYVIDHGRSTFTDRAHDSVLDVALAGGLVAAAGFVALLAALGRTVVRALRTGGTIDLALAAGLAAYAIQALFLFPLAELDPVFWIVAGLFVARTAATADPAVGSSTRTAPVVAGTALALGVVALVGGTLDVVADHRIRAAAASTDPVIALERADAARSLRPDSIRYHFAAGRIASIAPGDRDQLDRAAVERFDDGLDRSAPDPALLHERSLALVNRARRTLEPTDIAAALGPLAALDATDHNHPEGQQRYGIALALDGQTELAVEQFEHAASLTPEQPEALINLAYTHAGADDRTAAIDAAERARAIAPDDDRVRELLARLGIAG